MNSNSPVATAVAALETEKANLLARVEKVNQAIASLRALFHLPAERETKGRDTKVPDLEHSNSKGDGMKDAIRAALTAGPSTSKDLAAKLRVNKANVHYYLREMRADGVVEFIGVGRATKVALAAAAAKEDL